MKVFISWSGTKSHKVALVFRDWLPSVIQSIEPYVSSEDIDKGVRWSTDIAKELENSTFGILCVTKENLDAPWLSFEAGALSKTMDKSFVTPFLFDIKGSEVKGPILQFQFTIFQKEDIKKLINTLNKACGEAGIPDGRVERSFEVWYPILEEELNKLKSVPDELDKTKKHESDKAHSAEVLEEILDLSRNNQKLLRNPDPKVGEALEEIRKMFNEQASRTERVLDMDLAKRSRRSNIIFMEEMLNMVVASDKKNSFGLLILLSFFKNDFPWIFDLGKEIIDILKSRSSSATKIQAIKEFKALLDFTLGHPLYKEMYPGRRDVMNLNRLAYLIDHYFDALLSKRSDTDTDPLMA